MTEMQRWARSYGHAYQGMTGYRSDMIQDSEGEWVKFTDAEAAIADMLAKCIEVIDDMVIDTVGNSAATVDQVLDALRGLQEKS
jgi:hypothetical protein